MMSLANECMKKEISQLRKELHTIIKQKKIIKPLTQNTTNMVIKFQYMKL